MGYGYYILDWEKKPRGYNVECKCSHIGCKERINKGMDFLCYSCSKYFCGKHRTQAYDDDDNLVEFENFAGVGSDICHKCRDEYEKEHNTK